VQSGGKKHYTGTIDAWSKIYREEGGKAFFKVHCHKALFSLHGTCLSAPENTSSFTARALCSLAALPSGQFSQAIVLLLQSNLYAVCSMRLLQGTPHSSGLGTASIAVKILKGRLNSVL